MSGFEDHQRTLGEIELEIERRGVVLGIDWGNDAQVRALAREALAGGEAHAALAADPADYRARAKLELFGLVALMLRTMEETAADLGYESHGGIVWKVFARALWAEKAQREAAQGND